jgi:FHS family L-fucose permease-like MFS transporter
MNGQRFGISAAFATVTTLFFAWGFITSNNDPLIAALKAGFRLSYAEALLTQIVSFAAYGVVSIPAALFLARVGPLKAILSALATMIAGCLLVQSAAGLGSYGAILASLFVLGAGITALQVAANPLAAALGPAETSHFRLTLAQAFNSLGVVLGVNFGSRVMLGQGGLAAGGAAVTRAFLIIAGLLLLLTAFIWLSRKRIAGAALGDAGPVRGSLQAALRSRWAIGGSLAIALYVGAEVSIGSIMINFLNQPDVLGLPLQTAGFYLANIYWMGALAGRFLGSWLLTRIAAPRLLAAAAAAASALCLIVLLAGGPLAGWSALAVGLFNSIMFPTIFTITLERAAAPQSATSGLLCLAIVGGAILPWTVGLLADAAGPVIAFAVPMAAYAYIAAFALRARKARVLTTAPPGPAAEAAASLAGTAQP